MRLLVLRHGQTRANAEHRYLGALDPPLDDAGVRQVHDILPRLSAVGAIDALCSSPLLRARQTAALIGQSMECQVTVLAAFRERHVGVYEGLTRDEARQCFPALWAQDITRQWHAAPDGGETIAEVFARVASGLHALANACPHGTVLLVAHGFVAKVIRALVMGSIADVFDWQLGNGELLELHVPPQWCPPGDAPQP